MTARLSVEPGDRYARLTVVEELAKVNSRRRFMFEKSKRVGVTP